MASLGYIFLKLCTFVLLAKINGRNNENNLSIHYDISLNELISSKPISLGFISFANEWRSVVYNIGVPFLEGTNTSFKINQNVINLLSQLGGGLFLVNGNSGSYIYRNGSKLKPLKTWKQRISEDIFNLLNEFAERSGMLLVLGAPLERNKAEYTVDFIKAIESHIKPEYLYGIEIANEPDHFAIPKKSLRKRGYKYKHFEKEYQQVLNLLKEENLHPPLIGPGFAGCNTWALAAKLGHCWIDHYITFAQNTSEFVNVISYHRYGESGCHKSSSIKTLLEKSDTDDYNWLGGLATQLSVLNKTLIWGEGNAFSCGGKRGHSNLYGAALWYLDQLFKSALVGVEHAAIHTSYHKDYGVYNVDTKTGAITVLPIFYAQYFFNEILRRLLDSAGDDQIYTFLPQWNDSLSNLNKMDQRHIKCYGMRNTNNTKLEIIFFVKSPNLLDTSTTLTISFAKEYHYSEATVTRMKAKDLYTSSEININGQTYKGTKNGTLVGERKDETIYPVDGLYKLQVRPYEVVGINFRR